MLAKYQRLNLKLDFGWVAKGRRRESPHFTFFSNTKIQDKALVGVSMSKKNYAKSHERNRVKRLVFSIIKENYPLLSQNLNLIILPKKGILDSNIQDIKNEMERLLVDNGLVGSYNN